MMTDFGRENEQLKDIMKYNAMKLAFHYICQRENHVYLPDRYVDEIYNNL